MPLPLPPVTVPTAEVLAPADATVLPEIVLDLTPQPVTTATLENLSRNCLNPGDWQPMVNTRSISAVRLGPDI